MTAFWPAGLVERWCELCGSGSPHDPLSPEATAIPYVCSNCRSNERVGTMCDACNRPFEIRQLELNKQHENHWTQCDECRHLPVRTLATVVYCCSHESKRGSHRKCGRVATTTREWLPCQAYDGCDCSSCWRARRPFALCEEHAATWEYDLPLEEQYDRIRSRGIRCELQPDGSYSIGGPDPAHPLGRQAIREHITEIEAMPPDEAKRWDRILAEYRVMLIGHPEASA